jgi:hypothetical protein
LQLRKTAESSGKRVGFERRRRRMTSEGEEQKVRRIVDYGRLTEMKREKEPVGKLQEEEYRKKLT